MSRSKLVLGTALSVALAVGLCAGSVTRFRPRPKSKCRNPDPMASPWRVGMGSLGLAWTRCRCRRRGHHRQ